MPELIRSASLTGFSELCRSLKLDPVRLAKSAGVPVAALSDADLKVDSRGVGKLLDLAAQKSGAEDFGLRLAEQRRLSNLGPVGLIARDQPSLRKALGVMQQYLWLHNEALGVSVDEFEDVAIVRIYVRGGSRQAIELCVGVLCGSLRAMAGAGWRPEAVHFQHGAPGDLGAHRRVFGKTPQFLQDFDGLVLARADLDRPLASADPAMANQVEQFVKGQAHARPATMARVAGDLIVLLLPTGTCSAGRVASHLGIDRRTLHRRLTAEGSNFRALLDKQREELAMSLLRAGRSCTAVSELAGFSSVSAFSHWFQRRFGQAPSAYSACAPDR